jgi:hypothetical protein
LLMFEQFALETEGNSRTRGEGPDLYIEHPRTAARSDFPRRKSVYLPICPLHLLRFNECNLSAVDT